MGPNTQEQASSPDARWDHAPGEGDGDDEDEEDQDADAEAEEIARRLNDQLRRKRPAGALDALHRRHPGHARPFVLDALNAAVASNAISKRVARPLSHLLVSLAHSEVLFSSLRHHHRSEQPSIELVELGKKRRRDQPGDDDAPPPKRLFSLPVPAAVPPPPPLLPPMPYALHTQLDGASRAIISALTGPAAPPTGPPPPPLIASIQFPLHQVFLFAMTTAGPARNALQELGGLIQALGILSGVPIGGGSSGPGSAAATTTPWGHPGTAVYPCSFPGCGKTFARLYSLRAHTRVHSAERPFRCTRCPAAFARNHDLKRHERLHEDKAWQCTGCAKAFSRRDALTRHRNTSAARHTACANADVAEIEVPRGGTATGSGSASGAGAGAGAAEDEQLRRTRVWHEASDVAAAAPGSILEEGELPRPVLAAAHEAVARLHPVLQACVIRASSSAPLVAADAGGVDVAASQATLASALARVQAQLTAGNSIVTPSASAAPAPATATTATAGEGGVPPAYASSSSVAPPGSSLYGLSPEQTQMLEQAIASAASAAQLQAEAEAALEEEEEGEEVSSEGEDKDMEGQ
ncbi:hypothetical protein BJV74DRAFT_877912 [Russula compacta]|nr:hypothetical protein BJV74DRAFT_877912 [Russula compacta]